MITLKKRYESINLYKNQIVLDIETTGLDSLHDNLVLLGIIKIIEDKSYIIQYFAETDDEEERLLKIYLNEIKDKIIINYNGNNFDIPFLNNRLHKYNLDKVIPESMDIYRIITSKRNYFEFDSLKLMDIEKYIGINRIEPSRYKSISKLTDDIKKRSNPTPIMKHNENDLISTERLINVEEIFNEKLSTNTKYGKIILTNSYINNDIANFNLKIENPLKEAYFTSNNYEVYISAHEINIYLQVLYGRFDDNNRGLVAINTYDLINQTDLSIDPHLLIIRENRLYNYKNILNLSKKIIEEKL